MRDALFHPHAPDHRASIVPVCALLGLSVVTRCAAPPALAFAWEAVTVRAGDGPADCHGVPVRNARGRDLRKSTLEAAHVRALGYGMEVDPATHAGPLVEKSEENAAHDGRVVTGPVPRPRPGHVYQRLVHSERPGGRVEQLRVAVVGGTLPVLYVKTRPREERFASRCDDARLADPETFLSGSEQAGLLRLADEMGLDFGELDVLRDDEDGRLYVVDAATTPHGPPLALGTRARGTAVGRLAAAVQERFLLP